MKKVKNELIDERICNLCSTFYYEKILHKLFDSLKTSKYLYNSLNNEKNVVIKNLLKESNQKEFAKVINIYTNIPLNTDLFYSLLKINLKLTGDEIIYFKNTFLFNRSEKEVAELVGISMNYIPKIRKSCIVKMWIELEKYCKKI